MPEDNMAAIIEVRPNIDPHTGYPEDISFEALKQAQNLENIRNQDGWEPDPQGGKHSVVVFPIIPDTAQVRITTLKDRDLGRASGKDPIGRAGEVKSERVVAEIDYVKPEGSQKEENTRDRLTESGRWVFENRIYPEGDKARTRVTNYEPAVLKTLTDSETVFAENESDLKTKAEQAMGKFVKLNKDRVEEFKKASTSPTEATEKLV